MTKIKPYKRRKLCLDKPVEVYRNLHRGGYSVRQEGRVVGHTDAIMLHNAELVVQRAGYERWQREGVRNVHAWVRGIVSTRGGMGTDEVEASKLVRVVYDRQQGAFASCATCPPHPIRAARCVALNQQGAFGAYFDR